MDYGFNLGQNNRIECNLGTPGWNDVSNNPYKSLFRRGSRKRVLGGCAAQGASVSFADEVSVSFSDEVSMPSFDWTSASVSLSDGVACCLPPGTKAVALELSAVRSPGGGGMRTGALDRVLAVSAEEPNPAPFALSPGAASQPKRSTKLMTVAAGAWAFF